MIPRKEPTLFKSPTCTNRKLIEVLPPGSWKGHPAFITGGGPSLEGFDFSRLRGRRTIGINRSFEFYYPTINLSMDTRYLHFLLNGRYGKEAVNGEEALTRFKTMPSYKVWLVTYSNQLPDDIFIIPAYKNYISSITDMSFDLGQGIAHGDNSGFAAFNLAVCLGANPIYLLGFDFVYSETGKSHHHSGHPTPTDRPKLLSFKANFEKWAPEIKRRGIQVFNCSRISALKSFPYLDIDNVLTKVPNHG